jgi:hypothetical protein
VTKSDHTSNLDVWPPDQPQAEDNQEQADDIVDEKEDVQDAELGNEDKYNVLDNSDFDDNNEEITWTATVLESTDITPSGRLTVMLERPRECNFVGPRKQHLFLDFPLDIINYRPSCSKTELQELLIGGPVYPIKL